MYTFGQALKACFKQAFDFKRGASRSAYWWVFLANAILDAVFALVAIFSSYFLISMVFTSNANLLSVKSMELIANIVPALIGVYGLWMWFPLTSLTTRRLIDVGLTPIISTVISSVSGVLLVALMIRNMLPDVMQIMNPSFMFTNSYNELMSGTLMLTMSIASLALSITILVLTLMSTGKLLRDSE